MQSVRLVPLRRRLKHVHAKRGHHALCNPHLLPRFIDDWPLDVASRVSQDQRVRCMCSVNSNDWCRVMIAVAPNHCGSLPVIKFNLAADGEVRDLSQERPHGGSVEQAAANLE